MQKISRDQLIEKATALIAEGKVSAVLGWQKGEFDYDVTPSLFTTAEELNKDFVWNDFCGANFSKYLVNQTRKIEGKILVFLKPCDTYSFNQLLTTELSCIFALMSSIFAFISAMMRTFSPTVVLSSSPVTRISPVEAATSFTSERI